MSGESSVRASEVRTRRLVIEGDDGKPVATLEVASGGAGLWILGPDGSRVAIYAIEGQTALGLYDKGSDEGRGCDLALFMDQGQPTIQYRTSGGEARHLRLDELG
jgi:hypothetical protein